MFISDKAEVWGSVFMQKTGKIGILTGLIFIVSLSLPGYGIALNDALEDVLKTHPDILERQKVYNAAVLDMKAASVGLKPVGIVEGQLGRQGIHNSSTKFSHQTDVVYGAKVTIRKVLNDGGRTRFSTRAQKALAKATLHSWVNVANTVCFQTIERYLIVLKAQELMGLAKDNVEIHELLKENVKSRMESGKQGRSEFERVLGRLAAAQSRLITRQNDYKKAVYNFHKSLGRFIVGEEMQVPVFDDKKLPSSLKDALENQITNHPALFETEENIEQRKWELNRQKSEFAGKFSLEASRDWRDDFNGIEGHEIDNRVMLKFNHTIFDGGERQYRKRKMKSLIHREQQIQNRVRRSLINDLQLTWSGYKLLFSQLGALKKNLYFTRRALKTYKEEFRIGRRLLINVLDAENEYQTARAQLAMVTYDLLIQKYRILFSQGTLIQDLGLSIPHADELLDEKRLEVAEKDRLPLDKDFDKDKVENKRDISVNSAKNAEVNELGADKDKAKQYLVEKLVKVKAKTENLVKKESDLKENPIKAETSTKLQLSTFMPGSLELSDQGKNLMKDLINQIKPLAPEGLVQITVSSNEKKTIAGNYELALRRAYNFKRILQDHNIDDEGIQVFADCSDIKNDNSVKIQIATEVDDYSTEYETMKLEEINFSKERFNLEDELLEKVSAFAKELKRRSVKALDIIVYSNDFDNPATNQELSLKRADLIKHKLIHNGVPGDKIVTFGWGEFDDDPLLGDSVDPERPNLIKFVIRTN